MNYIYFAFGMLIGIYVQAERTYYRAPAAVPEPTLEQRVAKLEGEGEAEPASSA